MKTTVVLVVLLLTGGSAHAGGLEFVDGALRVSGAASGRGRSVWARGKTLVVVLPPKAIEKQKLKVGQAGLRDVRVLVRRNRTDVELRLDRPAERLLGKIELRDEGKDLLIVIDRAAARAAAARRAAALAAVTQARVAKKAKARSAQATSTKRRATPAKKKGAGWLAASGAKKAETAQPGWLKKDKKNGPTGGNTRIWLVAGLLFIGGGVAFFLRRRRRGEGPVRSEIDVVCSRALSGKQKLVVIEVESERLLLACSDKDVRMLHALGGAAPTAPAPSVARDSAEERQQTLEQIFGAEAFDAGPSRFDGSESRFSQPQPQPQPAATDGRATGRFIDQLEQQLARARAQQGVSDRQAAELQAAERAAIACTHASEDAGQELDEQWAEGIRRLRRARSAGTGQDATHPQLGGLRSA